MSGWSIEDILAVLPFLGIGFVAQVIDGALGMAYGLISSTLLISLGLPPAAASASVHAAEAFTTAASGASHVWHRNVDWRLLARLALPGVLGGLLGATLLSHMDASIARPFVTAYLAVLAGLLVWRGLRRLPANRPPRHVPVIAATGGFLDAAGGGGWGPVVTSSLLAQGAAPRKVIGTVNTAEFVLTLSVSVVFVSQLGWQPFTLATLGLLLGGVLAAPVGAMMAKRMPAQTVMVLVGIVLAVVSLVELAKIIHGWLA